MLCIAQADAYRTGGPQRQRAWTAHFGLFYSVFARDIVTLSMLGNPKPKHDSITDTHPNYTNY